MINVYVTLIKMCTLLLPCHQVSLNNPSSKQLIYNAMIVGQDKDDFNIPKGSTVTLGPRCSMNLVVEFTSRFLHPSEAVLVLVGRRHGAQIGSTLVFTLKTQIDDITTKVSMIQRAKIC